MPRSYHLGMMLLAPKTRMVLVTKGGWFWQLYHISKHCPIHCGWTVEIPTPKHLDSRHPKFREVPSGSIPIARENPCVWCFFTLLFWMKSIKSRCSFSKWASPFLCLNPIVNPLFGIRNPHPLMVQIPQIWAQRPSLQQSLPMSCAALLSLSLRKKIEPALGD